MDDDAHNTVLLLLAQFNCLNNQEDWQVIGRSDAEIGRNRLNDSLVNVINDLEV